MQGSWWVIGSATSRTTLRIHSKPFVIQKPSWNGWACTPIKPISISNDHHLVGMLKTRKRKKNTPCPQLGPVLWESLLPWLFLEYSKHWCFLFSFEIITWRCWAGFWSPWRPSRPSCPAAWWGAAPRSPLCSTATGPTTSAMRRSSLSKRLSSTRASSSCSACGSYLASFLEMKMSSTSAFLRVRTGETFQHPVFSAWAMTCKVPIASLEARWMRLMRKAQQEGLN